MGPVHLAVHLWNQESVCLQSVASHLWRVICTIYQPCFCHPRVSKPYGFAPFLSVITSSHLALMSHLVSDLSTTGCCASASLPSMNKRCSILPQGPRRFPTLAWRLDMCRHHTVFIEHLIRAARCSQYSVFTISLILTTTQGTERLSYLPTLINRARK